MSKEDVMLFTCYGAKASGISYIEHLKEKDKEIERLNTTIQSNINSYNKLAKYSSDLEDRIDKAIEYLESYNTDFKNCRFGEAPISMRELGDLLDILKGSDD